MTAQTRAATGNAEMTMSERRPSPLLPPEEGELMTRNCARSTDGQYCGRPHTTTRAISAFITMEDSPSLPDLRYQVDLCAEHATEYDEETTW
jgi:hypothetical protein